MDDNTVGSDSSGSSSLDLDEFGPPPGSFLYKCDVHPASPTTVKDVPPDDDSVSDEYLLDDPFVASYDDLVYDRTPVLDDFGSLDLNMLDGLSIHHVHGDIRVCNVLVDPAAAPSWNAPSRLDKGGLCDPGANICMTNNFKLLHGIRRLATPISVGVALDTSTSGMKTSVCTHVGYLLLPLTDGGEHRQRCYFNPSATDTFLSPHAVCNDSDGLLTTWSMKARTAENTGELEIASDSGL